jgi:hypothetical protein
MDGEGTRYRVTATVVAVLTAALIGAAPAAAANRFAAPGETDTSPCTAANPCEIHSAVFMASPGDDITLLGGGTYEIGSNPVFATVANTTVHGPAPGDRARIEGTDGFVQVAFGAVVRDVEIENTLGATALDLREDGTGGTAERVLARNPNSRACSVSDGSVLRDSVCWNTRTPASGTAVRAQAGGGDTLTATLRNVTAVATGSNSRAVDAISSGAGTDAKVLATNVIAQGGTPPSGGADVLALTDDAAATATVDLNHSNYDSEDESGPGTNFITDPGTGTGNQTDAPSFVDAAAGNFRQRVGSPTRNAGIDDLLNGPLDLDGEPRSQQSATDIGADEFDVIAPDTTITGGPSGTTPDPTPTFTFSSNQLGTFRCAVDGGSFGACSGPGASHTTSSLPDGAHTFRVKARDVSGNTDLSPAERSFTVDTPPPPPPPPPPGGGDDDTTAPETTIDKGPKKKTRKRKAKFRFSSDDPTATFECKLDKKDFEPCTSPKKYKKLKRRKHKFRVRATDAAGNVDQSPDKLKWKVKKKR